MMYDMFGPAVISSTQAGATPTYIKVKYEGGNTWTFSYKIPAISGAYQDKLTYTEGTQVGDLPAEGFSLRYSGESALLCRPGPAA